MASAKSLARLMKAWKYYRSVPVSSFYVEMRAAQHVLTQSSYINVWDVCQRLEKLDDHGLASMNDPKGASRRIYACSSDAKKLGALRRGCGGICVRRIQRLDDIRPL